MPDHPLEQFRAPAAYALVDENERLVPHQVVVPSEAELNDHYVAPGGRPALLPEALLYHGNWRAYADGMGRHARRQIMALAQVGVPLTLAALQPEAMLDAELHPDVWREVGWLSNVTASKTFAVIRHIVIHSDDFLRSIVMPRGAMLGGMEALQALCRRTIVYTSWERDRVDPRIVEILNQLGEVWVPCEFNREAFVSSGVQRVRIVPYPYDPRTDGACAIPEPRGGAGVPDGRRFYHIGKWEPRKNQVGLMRAFVRAFTPRDRVSLLLKTHTWGTWTRYPTLEEAQREVLELAQANGWTERALNRRIRIIDGQLEEHEIVELHRKNNIYVSASHGEAWDIPAFEARCAGNRLVTSPHAALDYLGDDDLTLPLGWEPADPDYRWEPDAQWLKVDEDALVDALRSAMPPEERVHPPDFYNRFGLNAVGRHMDGLLGEPPSLAGRQLAYG